MDNNHVIAYADEGSEYTYFSKKFCKDLGLKVDTAKRINMSTANGEVSKTYGTYKYKLFKIGDYIMRNKEVHVSNSTDYDILLGRDIKNQLNMHTIDG